MHIEVTNKNITKIISIFYINFLWNYFDPPTQQQNIFSQINRKQIVNLTNIFLFKRTNNNRINDILFNKIVIVSIVYN